MRTDRHNLNSLREIIRKLEEEIIRLRRILRESNIAYDVNKSDNRNSINSNYDINQGDRIINVIITKDLARKYYYYFWGRTDVYAKRGSKGGYFPQCLNRWNNKCPKYNGYKLKCDSCDNKKYKKMEISDIINHLEGNKEDCSDVIGIYPLLENNKCRFIVFDFDNHEKNLGTNNKNQNEEWKEEINILRRICDINNISYLVERSRSGTGGHLWIFFTDPIDSSLARNFAFTLLDKGQSTINIRSFIYYDRIYPNQDKTNNLGSLVALPLQGKALLNGNSAFVDEDWNAYYNQFKVLFETRKISEDEVKKFIYDYHIEKTNGKGFTNGYNEKRKKPWEKDEKFYSEDVIEKMSIVLSNGIYIDSLNIMPRLQNQIRSMAAFNNPIFFKNLRLGFSNYNNASVIYLGKDIDGYISIPRGLLEQLESKIKQAKIEYIIKDKRKIGKPIRVLFNGELSAEQKDASNKLLSFDNGILYATVAFGKTVLSAYLIAKRRISTLIIVNNTNLLEQWKDSLYKFLSIDEEIPTYKTKTGRLKNRNEIIGILGNGKNTLNGIIDIAMDSSLVNRDDLDNILDKYGMVIYDECHHVSSNTAISVLEAVKSKYVYGLTGTLKRSDRLEKIVTLLVGPIRYTYSAKQRALKQGIGHYVVPRYTNVVEIRDKKSSINDEYELISNSEIRNNMIINDVKKCIEENRTPLIITKYKKHAELLFEKVKKFADYSYIIYGDNGVKENKEIRNKLKELSPSSTLILVATSQMISEGFDYPRLDTLFLTVPFSIDSSRLEQSLGRINRDYHNKKEVIVYDYIDSHIEIFNKMYTKRLKIYKKNAYEVKNELSIKQTTNYIFDGEEYSEHFERDIIEANKSIIISCYEIDIIKVRRLLDLLQPRLEHGVLVYVVVPSIDNNLFIDDSVLMESISILQKSGIEVIQKDDNFENYAIIDDEILWHGNINLLGKDDYYSTMVRIIDKKACEEVKYKSVVK